MEYCLTHPAPDETKTTICVDTAIYEHEMVRSSLKDIPTFGPYGEANPEPLFVLENTVITNVSTHAYNNARTNDAHIRYKRNLLACAIKSTALFLKSPLTAI